MSCIVDNCQKRAHYGYTRATHCGVCHYEIDMVRITPACDYGIGRCPSIATFAYPNEEPTRCAKHSKKGMEKVKVKYPAGPEPVPKIKFVDQECSWENMTLWDYLREGNYPRMCSGWKHFFVMRAPELYDISTGVARSCTTIYPLLNKVFRAFIPMDKIKVVILGQDPYHNGSAVGLCFSVKPGNSINPSLRTIYKELKDEGYDVTENGDLTHWADQGCMMINTALTVEKGCPEAHLGLWYEFSEMVIQEIVESCRDVAWLLMGSKALAFREIIEPSQPSIVFEDRGHRTFITSHPMPLAAYRGFRGHSAFIGSGVFREINSFLNDKGKNPVVW